MSSVRRLSSGASLRPPLHRSLSDSIMPEYNELSDNNLSVEKSKNYSSQQHVSSSDIEEEIIEDLTPRILEEDEITAEFGDGIWNDETEGEGPRYIPERAAYIPSEPFDSTEINSTPAPDKPNSSISSDSYKLSVIAFSLGCLCILGNVLFYFVNSQTQSKQFDLELIKESFPSQNDDLWLAFESGVEDVMKMNRPSTFILLYKEEAEGTLSDLVHQLSSYAICNVRDCSQDPIEITETELNSAEVIRDYGILIEKYREKLEDRGVMIIKNLENVRGASAQAFHVFCDEFTPLVEKSLFIFTMKVEGDSVNANKFVEEYYKNKWTDVKIDTLNALITRITSMVLQVQA